MSSSADSRQRREALDPGKSFIVEAPAGSGKTELVTQRFLALLGTVELPEQIVAISFTRKAAAEVRERIVDTLRAATAEAPEVPPHRRQSLELAKAALSRSEALGWSLPDQSQRLRILTIDALNTSLASQLPILSNGIVSIDVTDEAEGLYRLAARRTSESLAEPGPLGDALRRLLGLSDNSLQQLESGLAGVLPARDRWLRLIAGASGRGLAEAVTAELGKYLDAHLDALRAAAGPAREQRLLALLRARDAAQSDEPAALWRQAAASLLTRQGSWRQRFTRAEGFPANDKSLREALDALLEDFKAVPGLRERLAGLAAQPGPAPGPGQIEALDALTPVLERLLAELRVVFAEAGSVDHTELAIAALEALGSVDAPSDLLLALDRRIEHILVDEFQDTSHLQWALLERLTGGWEAGDGRTLFLVGDPMQSIYRFRDADLSLFLKARAEGLGQLRLEPVELSVNFRSARQLVDWVNTAFSPVFPMRGAGPAAAPAFRPARAGQGELDSAGVEVHALRASSYDEEIARVVDILERELAENPAQSIGILVRSRTHLVGMRAALAAAGLQAHAVEIDSLADTQVGQDLIALTLALLHEGDRLAWLGVLRGPVCGLGWIDLHALCGGERRRTIRSLLADPACLERLTPEGRRRAEWLRDRLEIGLGLRADRSLSDWIRRCWLLIDGPASLASAAEVDRAETFFRDLDRLASDGDVDDPAGLAAAFARPSGAEVPLDTGIEIMTIHRAKGLEFDTVIVPALGRISRGIDNNLLIIQDIDLPNGDRSSLLATRSQGEPLYTWLKQIEREHAAAERARLLYVAVTRARARLHLIAGIDAEAGRPPAGSLLATLWPTLAAELDATGAEREPRAPGPAEASPPTAFITLPLRRLRFDANVPMPAPGSPAAETGDARPEFEWVHPASVQIGTLIHRELQGLAERADRAGRPVAPAAAPGRYARELALLGVEPEDLEAAARRVAEALERVWADPVGRWILEPRAESWSELRLSLRGAERLEHLRLDRSFVDDEGRRWIIDYKTGRHLGADIERFLDSEVARYREQLENYARAVAATDLRPIRVGLYFPLMSRLKDWVPAASPT